jgi:spore coat polysaccharide biosynthesis protein SpsF
MVLAVVQARMSSARMPGKVMAPVLGEPMIWRQLERVRRARTVSKVVVATSTASADDPLAGFLVGRGAGVFRADPADALGGLAACAAAYGGEHVVRLSADCPLTDPQVVDAAVALALESGAACTSNTAPRTYPEGLEVEVLTLAALEAAAREARGEERDQPALFLRRDPRRFREARLTWPRDLSAMRWTVERPEDFAFVRAVFQRLYPEDPQFGMGDVVELLAERPDLAALASRAQAAAEVPAAEAHPAADDPSAAAA